MPKTGRYVSAQLLRLLADCTGGTPDAFSALLQNAGVSETIAADPHARVSADAVYAALSALRDHLGAQGGLRLARRLAAASASTLPMSIMAHCAALDSALEKLTRYHDITSNSIRLALRRDAQGAWLVLQADLQLDSALERILVEAAVAACALMLGDITGGKARPESVRFACPAPADIRPYLAFFGCPVLFEQAETGLRLTAQTLRLPIAMSDPRLLTVLESYADSILLENGGGLRGEAGRFARSALLKGQGVTVQDAARRLSLSVRALQLRLRAEGASYRAIVEDAKKEIAVQSLRRGELPLCDIAFLLGFSEQSAFNHAFKRWTGQSPRQYAVRIQRENGA